MANSCSRHTEYDNQCDICWQVKMIGENRQIIQGIEDRRDSFRRGDLVLAFGDISIAADAEGAFTIKAGGYQRSFTEAELGELDQLLNALLRPTASTVGRRE
jgi:hypothetical protein